VEAIDSAYRLRRIADCLQRRRISREDAESPQRRLWLPGTETQCIRHLFTACSPIVWRPDVSVFELAAPLVD
jgi:hypothetical protein